MRCSHISVGLLLTTQFMAQLVAQNTLVSPVGAATVDGSTTNNFPFASAAPRRYQQLHGDLGAGAKLITQLSFRLSSGASSNGGTRIVDMELYLGEGVPALRPSFQFDANYVGGVAGRTLAIPRSNITFGPQGTGVVGVNPFTGNMDLVLTTPFLFSGTNSLLWEVVQYGSVAGASGGFGALDAEQGVVTLTTSVDNGGGCVPTGFGNPMTHAYTVLDCAGTLVINTTVANGPPNSFCILALGGQNPNATLPFLCTTLLTDAPILSVVGITDATGAITADRPSLATLVLQNGLVGLQLFTQVLALEANSTQSFPFVLSNGRATVVPPSNLTRVNQCSRIFNIVGGTTASEGSFFNSSVGCGLVTRFTYF